MYRNPHKLLLAAWLLLLGTPLHGQDRFLLGTFHSPRGVGITAFFVSENAAETDILTLRTDFYGLLAGRTRDVGACISYTHDYRLLQWDGPDYRVQLHAGAGGFGGYVHDFEEGYFSATERSLEHPAGWAVALAGNIALRTDFCNRLTLDVGFSAAPGVHLRIDRATGTLLASFFRNGTYHSFYPQVNLMYRF